MGMVYLRKPDIMLEAKVKNIKKKDTEVLKFIPF